MKDSATYQAILAEGEARGEARGEISGRIHEAKALLLRLGTRRFHSPSVIVADRVESIDDLSLLETLIERTIHVSSWEELLTLHM